METMKLTEKKKSSKGVIIGLLLFFIIGGTILFFAMRAEEEPAVVGSVPTSTQTESLVDVEKENKNSYEENKKIEYKVEDKTITDKSNNKMKANVTMPVISVSGEELTNVNDEISKYYTEMFSSLKEKMSSAKSTYTYTVTYNVYDNMVGDKKIISVTIYERILDDSAKKNTMDKIKTYNIDAKTKEIITQSSSIAQELFGKDYKTIIKNNLKDYVVEKKMMNESEFNYTYTGLNPFYIKNDEFHLVFNEGELVNEKYGVIDITITK